MKKDFTVSLTTIKAYIYRLSDFGLILITLIFAVLVDQRSITENVFYFILLFSVFSIIVFEIFGMYRSLIDHIGVPDMIKIFILVFLTNGIFALFTMLNEMYAIFSLGHFNPLTVLFISVTESFLLVVIRYIKRIFRVIYRSSDKNVNTLIVGAGQGGKLVYDEITNNKLMKNYVKGFLDDDKDKIGKRFLGKKVEGPTANIATIIAKYNIEEVIIAISNFSKDDLHKMLQYLENSNVRVKRLPLMTEMGLNDTHKIVDVSLEELLGREPITFDTEEIAEFIKDKVILITGAGGSIGSELCRQVFSYKPKKMVLFDIYENGVYDIQQELVRRKAKHDNGVELVTLIGSTYNENRVDHIFEEHQPNIVFHAAAYKHVPLMEDSPMEAIRTNIIGTYNVANASMKYKVQKMVLVSTDKAVRSTNVMGATKRYAEMIIQHFASITKETAYSAVRFGNVLGSNGSVIPLFEKQIAEGGPITITHPEITRFFMTIPEAVSLILQSGVYAKDGEIFILDMGKPVKIVDLAAKIIRQNGLVPDKDIKIDFIGLRPGEKLYEEILIDAKVHEKTKNNKIYVERNGKNTLINIEKSIEAAQSNSIESVQIHISTIVDTYKKFVG